MPDVLQDGRAEPVLDEKLKDHVAGFPVARLGELGNRSADPIGQCGVEHATDLDGAPVYGAAVAAIGADVLKLVTDHRSLGRVAQPL